MAVETPNAAERAVIASELTYAMQQILALVDQCEAQLAALPDELRYSKKDWMAKIRQAVNGQATFLTMKDVADLIEVTAKDYE